MTADQYISILKMAVENEAEAYEFYKAAAGHARDAALKTVFSDLAREELKHKALLEGYVNSGSQMHFDEAKDYKVSQTVESPKLSTAMTFADAIALAMKKEEEAMAMYQAFAEASTDEKQKETFMELSRMESGHKSGLEEIYVNSAYAEVW